MLKVELELFLLLKGKIVQLLAIRFTARKRSNKQTTPVISYSYEGISLQTLWLIDYTLYLM